MATTLDSRVSQVGQPDLKFDAQPRLTRLKDRLLPAAMAVGLGLVFLYGAAFAETSALHNAAHDGRHSAGFPCH